MAEVLICIIIALVYVVPWKGYCKVNEREESFLLAYKTFAQPKDIIETKSEDLISSDTIEDIPTVLDLNSLNPGEDYSDLDLNNYMKGR